MTPDQLIKAINALVEKGNKAKDKAEQYYAAAGLHLKTLREESPNKTAWEKLIRSKCGLGASRAYELIQIADGRKTVADVRLANAEPVRKHTEKRRSRPLANGQNLPAKVEPEPTLYCSFCGKSQHDVGKLIRGQAVFICDECAEQCVDIVSKNKKVAATAPSAAEQELVTTAAAIDEKREVMAVEIERLASRLIDRDRDSASELHRLLREDDGGHGVLVLTHALGRGLKGHLTTDDDGPRRAPKGCGENPWIKRETEPAPSAPAATADDYPDIPPSLSRAPKDAAARNIDGWQEVEPGFFEKVIDGKVERSAAFHPNLPEKDVADVLRGYEAQLMEPVHQRALDQWTAENGWRFLPTKEGGHTWRKVIDGKPYDIFIVADTADIARALAQAEKLERTRRKAAATRAARKRTNAVADSGTEAA
jgi:hypothetical protein